MKLSCPSAAVLAIIASYLWTVQAIPAWDMYSSRENIGELVPGTTIIHAFGPASSNEGGPHYLRSSEEPGIEGNATISEWIHPHGPPSLFFVSQGSLYQITNHTHILYADLVNATHDLALRERSSHPSTRTAFKLRLSKKKSGLSVGTWDWYTTMLQFKLGHRSNHGLFYKCTEETGEKSIYVPLDFGRTPDGCEILTLTSYTVRSKDE